MTPILADPQLEQLHSTATSLFTGALQACSIEAAFDRRIHFDGQKMTRMLPDGNGPQTVDLAQYKRIYAIAIGKAAVPMLDTLLDRMPRRKGLRGICCSNQIPRARNWRFRYFDGGHPLPNQDSFAAARATLALLRKAKKDTLVFFLISGGGSAMFDLPLAPDISLDDTIAFHQALLASGAPIAEINTLRKHFSAVKGGRLAMAAPEAAKVSILLPDVPLRSLDALASGPTTPDQSTVEQVRTILEKYHLLADFPASVRAFFEQENLPESPGSKIGLQAFFPRLQRRESRLEAYSTSTRRLTSAAVFAQESPAFRDSIYEILLSSHDLVESARNLALQAGFYPVVDNTCDDWDYADAARYLLDRFAALRAEHPKLCLISGGEVTVTLNRAPGAGGRNMQFALAAAASLAQHPGAPVVVFSAGSDGIDGNTRSAGAIADSTTVARALAFGFNPQESLAQFNACPLFTALGDSVVTGPTGHNLRDLRLLISDPEAAR